MHEDVLQSLYSDSIASCAAERQRAVADAEQALSQDPEYALLERRQRLVRQVFGAIDVMFHDLIVLIPSAFPPSSQK